MNLNTVFFSCGTLLVTWKVKLKAKLKLDVFSQVLIPEGKIE